MNYEEKIQAKLKEQGHSVLWLSYQLGISSVTIYKRMKDGKWGKLQKEKIDQLLNIE